LQISYPRNFIYAVGLKICGAGPLLGVVFVFVVIIM